MASGHFFVAHSFRYEESELQICKSWKLTDSVASCSTQILKEIWRQSGPTLLLLLLIVLGISSWLTAVSLVCPPQHAKLHFVNLRCHTDAYSDYCIVSRAKYTSLPIFNLFKFDQLQSMLSNDGALQAYQKLAGISFDCQMGPKYRFHSTICFPI